MCEVQCRFSGFMYWVLSAHVRLLAISTNSLFVEEIADDKFPLIYVERSCRTAFYYSVTDARGLLEQHSLRSGDQADPHFAHHVTPR